MPEPLHPLGLSLTVVDRWTEDEVPDGPEPVYETTVSACFGEVWVHVFSVEDFRCLWKLMTPAGNIDRLCEALQKAKTEALR